MPFCKRKCTYCDFYSTIYEDKLAASYVDIILKQLDKIRERFYTIYIGGGTPTALNINILSGLLNGLKRYTKDACEFTVEANPESLDEAKIKLLLASGVTRLSIGVQSLDDHKLKRLGRIHNSARAIEAVRIAAKAGFENLSMDLIFGTWNETPEAWKKELEKAVMLPVTHISSYSLSYEKNTPLFTAIKNGSVKSLEDNIVAQMYETAIEILSLRGFKQYEVSNFAKEGYESRHNMNYWNNNPYVGIGPSAVSYIEGVRSKNISDIGEYIKRYVNGKSLIESSEKLSAIKMAKETAAVKIRTKEGIDFDWFKKKTGFDFQELEKKALPGLFDTELIKYKKENNTPVGINLKRKGFLFCDSVSSALL
jgi:oxygen-independent coproporphyrinogen-3 oxidase